MNELKGLGTALITPFDANGKVDYEALSRLLDTQLTGFVDYLVVLGTTGEAATMTEEEKHEVRRFIVDYIKTSNIKHQTSLSFSASEETIPPRSSRNWKRCATS